MTHRNRFARPASVFLNPRVLIARVLARTAVLSMAVLISTAAPRSTQAAVFTLPQLESSQVSPVMRLLGAAYLFRSLEPPSHPAVFGVWLNARTNVSPSDTLSSIMNSAAMTFLPMANIQLGISAPFGLGVEFGWLPTISYLSTSIGSLGANLKWNFTKIIPMSPIDVAIRAHYSAGFLQYEQSLSGNPLTVRYDTSFYGGTFDISKVLLFFEPYIGYGLINQSATLTGEGSVSLFGSTLSNVQTVTINTLSGWFRAGFELKFYVVTLGFQFDNVFETDTYSAKFGFKF